MERPGEWTTLAEARRRLFDVLRRHTPVEVPLADAPGRTLATRITAPRDVPPFAASGMDGYALRAADTVDAPVRLRVVGSAGAGHPADGVVASGEAVAIATGGVVPEGADSVCPVEDVALDGDTVTVSHAVEHGAYVRVAGSDTASGDVVFAAGTTLGPAHIGVLASLGVTGVTVQRRVRVGVLATGDEIVEPPAVPGPGQIYDANRPALLAAVGELGAEAIDLGMVADEPALLEAALGDASRRCDVVITSGGVSVGVADHLAEILGRLAPDTLTWMEVRIRPGKPFGFAVLPGDHVPVLCLPGNPVSALVVFELLVRPALEWLLGGRAATRRVESATADEAFGRDSDGKMHVVRAVATTDAAGELHVRPLAGQSSHQLRVLADANALVLLDDGEVARTGDPVRVMLVGEPAPTGDGRGPS